MSSLIASAPAPVRLCPACGGANPADGVFCASPSCGHSLGEFRYVREEVESRLRWHEAVAARVTSFVAHPFYVVLHALWFILWVAANTGFLVMASQFDAYPFSLLGILLSIEAVFIGGFVLIAQNRQNAHAEVRAEIDYEVSVRTFREVAALRRELGELRAHLAGTAGES